jgi:PTS system nitrogen regulatory IIA component
MSSQKIGLYLQELATVLVHQCLSPETIVINDKAENTAEVIKGLSGKLSGRLGVEQQEIENAVWGREKARSTAFANGAAIPHCRLSGLKEFGIALLILHQPIRWDNEGHAVDTILMISGPSDAVSEHLRVLANASQLLDSHTLRNKLKQAPSPEAAYELICAAEEMVEKRRSEHGIMRELHRDHHHNGDYLEEVVKKFDW